MPRTLHQTTYRVKWCPISNNSSSKQIDRSVNLFYERFMSESKDLRVERGKQTRQSILTAAFNILIEDGPKGLTAGEISKRAEISKASLFHHFKSIEDVPLAILEEMIGKFSAKMSTNKAKSIEDYVLFIGKSLIEAHEKQKKITAAFVHFYILSAHDENFRIQQEKIVQKLIETIIQGFETVLKRNLTPRELETAPLLLVTSLEGMGILSVLYKNKNEFIKPWTLLARSISLFFDRDGEA
jgi:AcrR family transcriptional regulator